MDACVRRAGGRAGGDGWMDGWMERAQRGKVSMVANEWVKSSVSLSTDGIVLQHWRCCLFSSTIVIQGSGSGNVGGNGPGFERWCMLHPEPFSPEIVESEFRYAACGRNDGAQQQIPEVFF